MMRAEQKIKRKARKRLARDILHNIDFISRQPSPHLQQHYTARLVEELRAVARLEK